MLLCTHLRPLRQVRQFPDIFADGYREAKSAAAGIVKNHAHTIRLANPHLTADNLLIAPTPTMPPAIVCVVLTAIPAHAAKKREMAAAVSAQAP